jgi:hypothetical protein
VRLLRVGKGQQEYYVTNPEGEDENIERECTPFFIFVYHVFMKKRKRKEEIVFGAV